MGEKKLVYKGGELFLMPDDLRYLRTGLQMEEQSLLRQAKKFAAGSSPEQTFAQEAAKVHLVLTKLDLLEQPELGGV